MSFQSPSPRVVAAVALLALSGAWNAGNVGPVASQLAGDFGVSLAMVGVVSGTLFFAANVIGLSFAAQIGEKLGLVWGMRTACMMIVAGTWSSPSLPISREWPLGAFCPDWVSR